MDNNVTVKNSQRVLVVEVNACHGECLPGYIEYFLKLGYKVDVLIQNGLEIEKPLEMFSDNKDVNVEVMFYENIIEKLNSEDVDKYKYCLMNSDLIYLEKRFLLAKFIKKPHLNTKMIYICHDVNRFNEVKQYGFPVILKSYKKKYNKYAVNPLFFGNTGKRIKNSDTINFIVVGNIDKQRKNFNLLTDSLEKMIDNNISNFKITIIGQGDKLNFPEKIIPFIDIKGRLTYSDMYSELQNADYFLTLLDPENLDHKRYITTGTSGSFQLINGFCMPCLIEETFATPHGYDLNNAIVYKGNEALYDAMVKAINLDNNSYDNMQENLNILKTRIYNQSLDNFKRILNQYPFYLYSFKSLKLFFSYFIKQIFSVKNSKDGKNKVITIIGLKFKIKRKAKEEI